MIPPNASTPATRWLLARTSTLAMTRTTLPMPMRAATIAAMVTAVGPLAWCEWLQRLRGRRRSLRGSGRSRAPSQAAGRACRPRDVPPAARRLRLRCPNSPPSSWLSSFAAASGSLASVIARTTTARRRAGVDRGRQRRRVEPADREPRLADRARRVGHVVEPRGRAAGLGRRRVYGADRHVVDVGVGSGRVGLERRVRGAADDAVRADRARACAGVSSSWPTCTPSAAHASTRSGRSLRMNSAPCASAAARNGFAASTRPASSSVLSRSWIRSAPPRRAASRNARGRASQTRYRRASASRSRGVMPAVLQRYDSGITGARRTG